MPLRYRGRFAPSPTGLLHAGSLVAALASWLDARAHGGSWLVRIEDVDGPRCPEGTGDAIMHQLATLQLWPDEPVWRQSWRDAAYAAALSRLCQQDQAYPCACTRQDIAQRLAELGQDKPRHGELVYPGTCRLGLGNKPARAWRLRTADQACVTWQDRRLGPQAQQVDQAVGDFVLKRADGLWAYQLAVVVDDADQGISHVVRGEDLADNTARQILLQRALGLPQPRYLHTPLVLAEDGQKLSKQNGASALDLSQPLACLHQAGQCLGLPPSPAAPGRESISDYLLWAVQSWANLYPGD